ncbi:MAG: GIY-YIG nuclease family protein [Candidatus Peregrinibacteria bacterium]|nr:GIY-YIG nuclease family protein [Candidatus Peregrinibacteria bacterium]MCB9808408.1 GIY-YIG nuclease family protein [Candidatus Peribacteria bacterium]
MYWVYLLRCSDGSPYTGSTPDLKRRLHEHASGKSKSTCKRLPVTLRSAVLFPDRLSARRFEAYLKSGSGRAFAKRHFP